MLPRVRVSSEQLLIPAPVVSQIDRPAVAAAAPNALTAALAAISIDDVLTSVQAHDPLSRHCLTRPRSLEPRALEDQQRATARNTAHIPRPKRCPSPAPPARPLAREALGHRVLRTGPATLLVTFDALRWPVSRSVVHGKRGRECDDQRSPRSSMSRTAKRRR